MEDNREQPNSPLYIQSESRSHDGGAFTVARALRLARVVALVLFVAFGLLYVADKGLSQSERGRDRSDGRETGFDAQISRNAQQMFEEGRQIFRFHTFGDEVFWGDRLKLHQAIQGSKIGGVGAGVSPKAALAVGLKVDMEALPAALVAQIKAGKVNLDDPATTLELLKLNSVVGVKGTFNSQGRLQTIGLSCAVCHSTVDDAFMPGVGRRLDGWPNRDLNVGAIISMAPDLSAFTSHLQVDEATVKKVFASWGPGKFDAELNLDGKAFRPDGKPAATLIPPAFGMAGINLHTWTGGWGTTTYWNAYVANLELQGQGNFFDERLNNAEQYPLAARAGLGNKRSANDMITSKLAALHFYQLAIPTPRPPEGSFDRTAPLRGLFAHTKGGFYHDGRFATLLDVVNHYNNFKRLNLSEQEKRDLVEYLKSL